MTKLETSIIIDKSPEIVRDIVLAFDKYSEWPSFIQSITCSDGGENPKDWKTGDKLHLELLTVKKKEMAFDPVLVENSVSEFSWNGILATKFLFSGRHSFRFESYDAGKTKFVHEEEFSGILSPAILYFFLEDTKASFQAFNESLKKRAEAL